MEAAPQAGDFGTLIAQAEAISSEMSALENCINSAALPMDGDDSIITDAQPSGLPDQLVEVRPARDETGRRFRISCQ